MLIANGHVVSETGAFQTDILVRDGKIASIGEALQGEPVLDATDCYVLPGAIDPHVHVSLEGHSMTAPLLEDLVEASRSALMGGVTAMCAYVQRTPEKSIVDVMKSQIEFGNGRSLTDFALNALVLPGDDIMRVVEYGNQLGITTYKAFLSYRQTGHMLTDEELIQLMAAVAEIGGVTLVHAENGWAIDYLNQRERYGTVDAGSFLRSQPGALEAEGMFRAAIYAELTGTRLLFVHLSSEEGSEMLRLLRSRTYGAQILCETQPHYLSLTNREVLERGALGKVGPPLREPEDVQAVWQAVEDGLVNHLSSDHSPKSRKVKLSTSNILDATYGGIIGVETLFPLAFSLGFEAGRLPIEAVARLTSTNTARAYGLYPRKGVIRPGSDADLIVVPMKGEERKLTPENLHSAADYSLYESLSSRGFPRYVVRAGQLAVRDGELVSDAPPGQYLPRQGKRKQGPTFVPQ